MIDQSADNIKRIQEMARRMRLAALDMALTAGDSGSHLGGGLSCIEIMAVLYGAVMQYDVSRPTWSERDRFFPSKNHCVLAHFPALCEAGFLSRDELLEFKKDGGRLTGYPRNLDIGLEYSGGSLGMAISVGVGVSLALREQNRQNRVYVLMGDGELDEGSIWEAFMSAAHYRLSNLTVIIDRNHLSYDGDTESVMALGDLTAKLTAFGWHVVNCNGHNIASLLRAFASISDSRPTVIIADTVKGKGVSFIENRREWHHNRLTKEQYAQAVEEVRKEDVSLW